MNQLDQIAAVVRAADLGHQFDAEFLDSLRSLNAAVAERAREQRKRGVATPGACR